MERRIRRYLTLITHTVQVIIDKSEMVRLFSEYSHPLVRSFNPFVSASLLLIHSTKLLIFFYSYSLAF